ncbi:DNA-protecting protein DprA [Phototrophicus methaneseepsis]|uniref:DNA-protecting protein DprA n=1 Tax=Phototrophicus methaneseepsis TaxID=2710758 RepID=A0A7S8E931_9CHLR|nr:DNA-processing protein DprA [Phototrophicus methaneseepsis]QPC82629.1 DNA-protecting protein DprA [Phototrophicus methaneseepsis]
MRQPDDLAWIALSLQPHIGLKTLSLLLAQFGSPSAVLAADAAALQQVRGIGAKLATAITQINLEQITRKCTQWARAGVQILPLNHPHYPESLRQLDDAPPTLFVQGQILITLPPAIALIGTRLPCDEARFAAYYLGRSAAEAGYIVASGMALGIDAAAHMGALATEKTLHPHVTVAVLGSGVLQAYPTQHRKLAQKILKRGALISETAPDAAPNAPRLVSRNRLITGIATKGVIVLETSADGGAMHAARFAQAQGRPLYTLDLPAPGNQALIQAGAVALPPDIQTLDFLKS